MTLIRPTAPLSILLLLAAGAWPTPAITQVPAPLRAQYDSAYFAWDRGDYLRALDHAERILTSPDGDLLLRRVALLTGELFPVQELTTAGHTAQWSPDGRHATFESRIDGSSRIHLLEVTGDGAREIASFAGWSAAFSPDGSSLGYLRLPGTPAATAALAEAGRAPAGEDAAAARAATQALASIEVAEAQVVVRDLSNGAESPRDAGAIERHRLAFAGDGTAILIGRQPGETDRLDLYRLETAGAPVRMTEGPGMKGATLLAAGPDRLIHTIGSNRIAILDLRTGTSRVLDGNSPAISRDGSTLAYLAPVSLPDQAVRRGEAHTGADGRGNGALTAVMVLPLRGTAAPHAVKQTTLPLASPALSPSGRRVAYGMVLRDDWEIFVFDVESGDEARITRDIQHDLLPRFLTEDRLLGLMGEARHRRSYLYELDGMGVPGTMAEYLPGDDQRGRIRIFDNNTLRTVAPQYEWVPSPDGGRLLVVADRDGDTLSPETGVYLVELERTVSRQDVLARIGEQRGAETRLREMGRRIFAPIEEVAGAAAGEVDPGRVYDHAHALFQFGSKGIAQPGNALAIAYLESALRGMGYEPELQWFEPRPGVRTANVVATLPGTVSPERIHVISSHFDSVDRSSGADDNSSGTTALLEVARVLASRPQPETIRFAFLTAEEVGLLGAFEFVRRARAAGDRIVSNINNDMVGWTRSHRLDNTIRYSNERIRDIMHNAAILFSDLITYDARYVRSTDAQAFWDGYGDIVGGIGSYPILSNPHYHQSHDNLEVVNHRLVAEVARTTAAAIVLLANGG